MEPDVESCSSSSSSLSDLSHREKPITALKDALDERLSWKATLPFEGVIDMGGTVDLFDFVGKKTVTKEPMVKFDPVKWQPTSEGMKALIKDIQACAIHHGSYLNHNGCGILICNHGIRYRNYYKKNQESAREFDDTGVMKDYRGKRIHNDRLANRKNGQRKRRASSTCKDVTGLSLCKLRLSLKISPAGENNSCSFIYLCCTGNPFHTHHPQPGIGALPMPRHLLGEETINLIKGGHASVIGHAPMRKLVLETKSTYLSKSTHRAVIDCVPDFLKAGNESTGTSSASELMTWLRNKASDPEDKLVYTVLSYQGNSTVATHIYKNPKGRPSKTAILPTTSEVAKHMTFRDQLTSLAAEPLCDEGLFSLHNVPSSPPSFLNVESDQTVPQMEVAERLPVSVPMDQLIDQTKQRRLLFELPWLSKSRMLVGAAWMRDDDYRKFLRFPEVLFMDSTHKSNNESRPLLLICGRDSDGTSFVIIRVFMPNETQAFYRWVFLEALPKMLGVNNLQKVVLTLTDGDSQEFNALDEAIFRYFPNALRGRCGHHLIEKSYEKHGPSKKQLADETVGSAIVGEIKRWVRSWANGSSCGTKMQYELSKGLLLHTLKNNMEVQEALGNEAVERMIHWILNCVDCHEQYFCFYRKRMLRCRDEYCTNMVEGLNYGAKHGHMSSKPNFSLATAANAMNSHDYVKDRDKRSKLTKSLTQTPLYVTDMGGHDTECLRALRPMATSMIIDQFKQKGCYEIFMISTSRFVAIRSSVMTKLFRGCPNSFKGPPQFREAHTIDISICERQDNIRLTCSCGFKHRYGIVCRHLLALEKQYDVSDIDVRWQTAYALESFVKGKETLTRAYVDFMEKSQYDGIRVKSKELRDTITQCNNEELPKKVNFNGGSRGNGITVSQAVSLYESQVPVCWNYSVSEYPRSVLAATGNQQQLFTQESIGPDGMHGWDRDRATEADYNESSLLQRPLGHKYQALRAMAREKFKELDRLCTDSESTDLLLQGLHGLEEQICRYHLQSMPKARKRALEGDPGDTMISFALPIDNAKRSTQHTYKHK